MRKLTLGQFKVQAILANAQDFYDYSKSIYLGDSKKLTVTCAKHGDFKCTPSNHKRGKGCPECKLSKISAKKSKGIAHFLEKAHEVHGALYDYSMVEMSKCTDFVDIICKVHGVFNQKAAKHLTGRGCQSCANNKILSRDERIQQAVAVHGNAYSYDLLPESFSNKSKVDISCLSHGVFSMNFADHIFQQSGCPLCKGRIQKQAYINKISDGDHPVAIKFGIAKNYELRLIKQNRESKFELLNIGVWEFSSSSNCKKAEQMVKSLLSTGIVSKQDVPDGYTETVAVDDTSSVIEIYESFGGVRIL